MTQPRAPRILSIDQQCATLRAAAEAAIEHGDHALGGLLRLIAHATASLVTRPDAGVSDRDTEERMRWSPAFQAAYAVAREVLARGEAHDLDALATSVRHTVRP